MFLFNLLLHCLHLFSAEKEHIKYPRSLDDAKRLGSVLSRYKDQHFYTVLAGVIAVYIVFVYWR